MFERVDIGIGPCVTPFPYAPFEREKKQPANNILKRDVALYEKLKKMISVLKDGCFTLNIKVK